MSFSCTLVGWQRVSSYDQLSSLSLTDTASNLSLLSSHPRPSSPKPNSSCRPHSRARLSDSRAPAPDITNLDLPIPLFDKTDPMQFLDIMKGVSARLDENVGVRPRRGFNSCSGSSTSRPKKRTRGVSLGGTLELQAGKASRGVVKKGRVDELRASRTLTWDEGKGNGRVSEDESLGSEVRGRGLQAHSSLPDIFSRSDLTRSLSSKDVSFMDVDDKDDSTETGHVSLSSSSNHGYPDTPFPRTLSQTQMPPPPFVCDSFLHKQCQPTDPPRQQSNASTPLRHSNSINQPQTLYPPSQQPSINHSIEQPKPDAIPKLHPLLYQKSATSRVSASSTARSTPRVQPQPHLAPIPASESPNSKPPPSSFTPLFSSTPSARPPPLGMRRNHTFPSRTSSSSSSSNVQQESSSSLTVSGGPLPQRQKGFKPPLLSLSQPQAQTQTHSLSRVKANANVIVVESGSTIAGSTKVSSQNLPEASSTDSHGLNTTSDTPVALRSSSSDSSPSFRSTPPNTSSPSSFHLYSSNPLVYSTPKKFTHGMAQQPQASVVIPEPVDGDPDSSFGDMSLDMDALEETMKMYD